MAILNSDRGTSDVWIVDLATGRRRRLTGGRRGPPRLLLVARWPGSPGELRRRRPESRSDRASQHRRFGRDTITALPGWLWPWGTSPDGRFAIFVTDAGRGGGTSCRADVWRRASVSGRRGPGLEGLPQISRDGRFVAYTSNESGRFEVYVTTFPDPGGKWQVSQDGGSEPRWSRSGRELFFVDRENRIQSVEVDPSAPGFEAGTVRPLFAVRSSGGSWRYDVSSDDTRFLVMAAPEGETARSSRW